MLEAGDHVVITPDGPRGPRRVAAPGVAQLAALSGMPVLPCAAQTSRRWTLRSWDRMVLPLPFGRGVIVCGAPIAGARATAPRRRCRAIAAAITAATDAGRPPVRLILPLYAAAATLGAPALRLMLARRLRRGKEIAARLPERWGIEPAPRPPGRLLWLHAASVGETVSVLPVLQALAGARASGADDHRHRHLGRAAGPAAAGARAGAARAAPLRAAGRAGLGGAVPRPLAARRGRLRGERDLAEPDRRLPPPRAFR